MRHNIPPAFCNRRREIDQLLLAAKNAQNVLVYSLHGMGKTALCHKLLSVLPKEILAAYVPLSQYWLSASRKSSSVLAAALLDASVKAAANNGSIISQVSSWTEKYPTRLSWNDIGTPEIKVSAKSHPSITDAMQFWEELVKSHYASGIILFDDLDTLLDDQIERELRSIVQHVGNTSHVFLMSNTSKAQRLFFDRNSPFFRSGSTIYLGPIPPDDWHEFLTETFHEKNIEITPSQINKILEVTEGFPLYTMMACSIFNRNANSELRDEDIQLVLDTVNQQATIYSNTLLDGLAPNQRMLLIAIADAGRIKPFSSKFIADYDLKAPSNVQRALEALDERNLVQHDPDGTVSVHDPILRRQLQSVARNNPLFLE